MSSPVLVGDGVVRWPLTDPVGVQALVQLTPRLVSSDLRVQLEAAPRGVGIALLPEPVVTPALTAGTLDDPTRVDRPAARDHLLYPAPRGMLPSVRSLIDHLSNYLPDDKG